jgi:nickel transport protein
MPANAKNFMLICICAIMLLLLLSAQINAHRVNIFCWAEGQKIFCESSFPGGSAVKEGKIRVLSKEGQELLKGQTDAQGRFSFVVPEDYSSDLKIVVEAGMGHKNSWPIKAKEYLPAESTKISKSERKQGKIQDEQSAVQVQDKQTLDRAEIKELFREVLAKELSPLKKQLAKLRQDRITVQDVISGLGYILGLMGIALYFKAKNN